MPTPGKKFEELRQIIVTLRQPGGCPWDIKQTPDSFKSYLLEEAHELLEAIDRNDPAMVKEELGDLLFQLIFINQLFEEQGRFTLSEVISGIINKMIQRHPHVFGDEVVTSDEDQRRRWNELKSKAKEDKAVAALLKNVPRSLPGLRRAQRVSERAAHNGFEWQDLKQAFAKLDEEVGELTEAVSHGTPEQISDELGDVLFMLVNLGRLTKTNSEDALQATTDKFISRFTLLEQKAQATGRAIADLPFAEQLALWAEVKSEELITKSQS
jgi:tetrapyrrole methylase family protein/MazG family protein